MKNRAIAHRMTTLSPSHVANNSSTSLNSKESSTLNLITLIWVTPAIIILSIENKIDITPTWKTNIRWELVLQPKKNTLF